LFAFIRVAFVVVSGFAQKLKTPKALANSSPWLFQPWVQTNRNKINSNGVRERFQRWVRHTQRNPGLETLG
jgi:hypothetical protein